MLDNSKASYIQIAKDILQCLDLLNQPSFYVPPTTSFLFSDFKPKPPMLLGSIQPKLDRQHEKANLENTLPLRLEAEGPIFVVITIHVGFILFLLSAK